MKRWATICCGAIIVIVIGLSLGFGAIKIYQSIYPTQKSKDNKDVSEVYIDPVKDIRQICTAIHPSGESKLYGDMSRQLSGDDRDAVTFTGIAQVLATNPVVLDFDTTSVRPIENNPVFDEAIRKLPTRQFVVTDSAIYGLKIGDVIRASVDYSSPKISDHMKDLSKKEKEVAVKLQNAIVVTDQQKQGLFAKDFTLYSSPSSGVLYMASGDVYNYSSSTKNTGGIEDVSHHKDSGATLVAKQFSKLKIYSKKGDSATTAPSVYCGVAYTSKNKLSTKDTQAIRSVIGQ